MRILATSHLFPTHFHPGLGPFVRERGKHVDVVGWARVCVRVKVTVVVRSILAGAGFAPSDAAGPSPDCIPDKTVPPLHFLSAILMDMCSLLDRPTRRFRRQYDVIDVHWTFLDAEAGWHLGRLYRMPVLVTVRGVEALYQGLGLVSETILRAARARGDRVISVSQQLADMRYAFTDKERPPLRSVITNGVDAAAFRPGDRGVARRELGFLDGHLHVVSVGRFSHGKGLLHSVAAWPGVVKL